jgi:hypothetical protein
VRLTSGFFFSRCRFPNYFSLGPNIQFLANNSVRGVFEEGSGVTSGDGPELEELKDYVMASLLWDPSRDPATLIDEFLNGYYSPSAAPFIKQYMYTMHAAYVQEYTKDNTVRVQACCFAPPGGAHQLYLTADAILKGATAFNGALHALQQSGGTNTTKYRNRVLRATLSVKYTALWRWAELQSYAANASIAWPFVTTSRQHEFDKDFSAIYNRTGVERLGDAKWLPPLAWMRACVIRSDETDPKSCPAKPTDLNTVFAHLYTDSSATHLLRELESHGSAWAGKLVLKVDTLEAIVQKQALVIADRSTRLAAAEAQLTVRTVLDAVSLTTTSGSGSGGAAPVQLPPHTGAAGLRSTSSLKLDDEGARAARPTVLAFYMGGPLTYWTDFDWDILTHVVCYGSVDENMVYYARQRGVKVLRTMALASVGMNVSSVRAKMTRDALSLSAIPPCPPCRYNSTPGAPNPPFDGLFFDVECKAQPCPWLTPEEAGGMAQVRTNDNFRLLDLLMFCVWVMAMNHISVLVSGFRVVSVSSIQR